MELERAVALLIQAQQTGIDADEELELQALGLLISRRCRALDKRQGGTSYHESKRGIALLDAETKELEADA